MSDRQGEEGEWRLDELYRLVGPSGRKYVSLLDMALLEECNVQAADLKAVRDENFGLCNELEKVTDLLMVSDSQLKAAREALEALEQQVKELSEIIADKYGEVGRFSAQVVALHDALQSIKDRAARVVEETEGKDWFSQNAYAKADDALRRFAALSRLDIQEGS